MKKRKYKYKKSVWNFMGSKEVEINGLYDYGARGQNREKKIEATPEQMAKQNQKNRENRVRRLLKENFVPGDWWITLKYPAGVRKSIEEVEKDFQRFRNNMRNEYKKRGRPFHVCVPVRNRRERWSTYPHGDQPNTGQ